MTNDTTTPAAPTRWPNLAEGRPIGMPRWINPEFITDEMRAARPAIREVAILLAEFIRDVRPHLEATVAVHKVISASPLPLEGRDSVRNALDLGEVEDMVELVGLMFRPWDIGMVNLSDAELAEREQNLEFILNDWASGPNQG